MVYYTNMYTHTHTHHITHTTCTHTQSHVLGSFYWGYMVAPLLSHHLSSRYGGEKVQWLAAIVWSLCLPLAVQMVPYSQVMLLSLQFIRGLTQGEASIRLAK